MNFVLGLTRSHYLASLTIESLGLVVKYRSAEFEGVRFDSAQGIQNFSLSHALDKTKKISISSPSSKLNIFLTNMTLSRLLMLAVCRTCYMNFEIDLAHHRVSVAQQQSMGARNPKVWGSIPHGDLEFLSHARDKRKDAFLCHYILLQRN